MKSKQLPELKTKVTERRQPAKPSHDKRGFFEWWDDVEHMTQEPDAADPPPETEDR
jgi:hypothetical protein